VERARVGFPVGLGDWRAHPPGLPGDPYRPCGGGPGGEGADPGLSAALLATALLTWPFADPVEAAQALGGGDSRHLLPPVLVQADYKWGWPSLRQRGFPPSASRPSLPLDGEPWRRKPATTGRRPPCGGHPPPRTGLQPPLGGRATGCLGSSLTVAATGPVAGEPSECGVFRVRTPGSAPLQERHQRDEAARIAVTSTRGRAFSTAGNPPAEGEAHRGSKGRCGPAPAGGFSCARPRLLAGCSLHPRILKPELPRHGFVAFSYTFSFTS
jgi:hypothetical protein